MYLLFLPWPARRTLPLDYWPFNCTSLWLSSPFHYGCSLLRGSCTDWPVRGKVVSIVSLGLQFECLSVRRGTFRRLVYSPRKEPRYTPNAACLGCRTDLPIEFIRIFAHTTALRLLWR